MMFSYNIENHSDQTFEFQLTLGDIYFIHFDIVRHLLIWLDNVMKIKKKVL